MNTIDILKILTSSTGVTGDEYNDAGLNAEKILSRYGSVKRTKSGSLSLNIPGSGKKILLDAHLDRIGLIVTGIDKTGFLRVDKCGGIDRRVMAAARVTVLGKEKLKGVIISTPPHLAKNEDADKALTFESAAVDAGLSYDEISKIVKVGDRIVFDSDFTLLSNGLVTSPALDDRAGCYVLIDIIRSETEYDAWFSFSVQEEIGARGAGVSAYTINPDYAVVIETTTAADIIDVPEHRKVCELGKGAAISFMDRSTVYLPEVYSRAVECAEKNSIPYQMKTLVAGGNNAGSVHKTRAGIKTVTVNIPCRYLHSPSCVCDERDIESVRNLAAALISEFADD